METPTVPRPAATVVLLRGGSERLEVLLVQRTPAARFMGGAWVFPGGAVDPGEDHRTAAVREVAEEAGVTLPDPDALVPFARWITPPQSKIRFDTHFFLAAAPDDAVAVVDGSELVDLGWFAPRDALDAGGRDELQLEFPTVRTLETLTGFESAAALLAWADGREIEPITPRIVYEGEAWRVVLPGEPGYRD